MPAALPGILTITATEILQEQNHTGANKCCCCCCCCCCCVASVVSDSVRPHRWQPTRLPRPWDSPGKNTGVGCHFLLRCVKVKSESEVAQSCPTLSDPMDCSSPGSSVHGIFQARVLEWGAIAFSETNAGYKCTFTNTVTWSYIATYRHVSEDANSPGIFISLKIIYF